jgi:hypothetical protein
MTYNLSEILSIDKLRAFTRNGGEQWCRQHFSGYWNYNFDYDRLFIRDTQDYTLFMLRWA